MSELLPPATQQFLVDASGAIAGLDLEIAAMDKLAATTAAVSAEIKGMEASLASAAGGGGAGIDAGALDASAAAADRAAASQTALGDAEKIAADAATIEADSLRVLAEADAASREAALASVDATLAQGRAYKAVSTVAAEAAVAAKGTAAATTTAASSTGKFGTAAGKAGAELAKIGKAAALAGVVVAIESVKMASSFDQAMVQIHTQAGAAGENIHKLGDEVLTLSGQVGIAPQKLAEGLYHVESAGFRGAKAMEILASAAKLSAIGLSDMETTTQAVVGVMASEIRGVRDAADAGALLNTTVGIGDMRMNQLAHAIATGLLPKAKQAGLSFQDVGAALATLTDNVTPADEAATRLGMTFSLMSAPTKKAQVALNDIGMSSVGLANDIRSKGLYGALVDLQAHLNATYPPAHALKLSLAEQATELARYQKSLADAGLSVAQQAPLLDVFKKKLNESGSAAVKQSAALSAMFGGGKSSGAVLTLLGEMDRLKTKTEAYGTATTRAKQLAQAWAEQQKQFSQQTAQLRATFDVLMVKLGNYLIPIIQKVVGYFAAHQGAAKALAITIGGVLVAAIVAAGVAFVAATWEVLLVIAALAAIGAAIYFLWTRCSWFRTAVEVTWHAIAATAVWLWHAMEAVWKGIAAGAVWLWNNILKPTGEAIATAWHVIAAVAVWLWHALEAVWHGISAGAMWLWHAMEAVWHGIMAAWHAVAAVAMWLWHNVITPVYDGVVTAHNVMWKIVGPLIHLWMAVMKLLGAVIVTAYRQFIEPAFKGIALIVSWAWNSIIKPTFGAIVTAAKWVGAAAMWLWHNALEPAFKGIGSVASWLWKNAIEPAFKGIGSAASWLWNNAIGPAFSGIGSAISGTWDFIRGIFNALVSAAQWVGDKISSIFGGIGHLINGVTGGVNSITHMLGFAEGGPVPGADGAPIAAILHGGEYVLSREMIANITSPGGGSGADAFTTTPVATSRGGGGGHVTVVNVNVHVAGSVTAQRDLQHTIQQSVLQMNLRNSNNRYSLPVGR